MQISISSSIECTEIRTEAQTPEEVRASSQQKDAMPLTPNQNSLHTASPPQPEQTGRTISSRYVLDRPAQTVTPDPEFLKNFDSAMSILKEITPIKNSMIFQRERELTIRSRKPQKDRDRKNRKKSTFLFKKEGALSSG